jgi:hypothetical protein
MTERETVEILRWLYFAEVHYQNIYIQEQDFFFSQRFHDLDDFIRLQQAEQRFKDFKKFASDLVLLLRLNDFLT